MKYDINDIMKILPHRYPFLLVDRIESINEDKTVCVAIKNVTANEPQFTGHFPSVPVMPGVLIIEAMAQCGAILALERLAPEEKQQDVWFRVTNCVSKQRTFATAVASVSLMSWQRLMAKWLALPR